MPGTVELRNRMGEIVQTRRHNNMSRRNALVEMWKKLYGKKFAELEVVDIPDQSSKQTYEAKSGIKPPKMNRNKFGSKATEGGRIW